MALPTCPGEKRLLFHIAYKSSEGTIAVFMFRAYDTSSWLQYAPIHADKQETEFCSPLLVKRSSCVSWRLGSFRLLSNPFLCTLCGSCHWTRSSCSFCWPFSLSCTWEHWVGIWRTCEAFRYISLMSSPCLGGASNWAQTGVTRVCWQRRFLWASHKLCKRFLAIPHVLDLTSKQSTVLFSVDIHSLCPWGLPVCLRGV